MKRRRVLSLLMCVSLAGCGGHLIPGFMAFGNPPRLVGTWVDSALAMPTDTIAWVFGARGLDQTLTIHLATDSTGAPKPTETLDGYGYWYVAGNAMPADTGRICFRGRGRGRDACFQYQLSNVRSAGAAAARTRRRLLILAYQGRHHTRDRVLIER